MTTCWNNPDPSTINYWEWKNGATILVTWQLELALIEAKERHPEDIHWLEEELRKRNVA